MVHRFWKTSLSVCVALCLLCADARALTPNYACSSSYASSACYRALCNVQLTGDQRADIIAVALSQNGYHEGSGASDLSGVSSGESNYTEYGYWVGKTNVAWCAAFLSWCASQAGVSTYTVKRTASAVTGTLCSPAIPFTANCAIQPGDIIYLAEGGNHVGLVWKVDTKYIYTVEGNTSDRVRVDVKYNRQTGNREWGSKVTDRAIEYYASPNYIVVSPTPSPTPTSTPTTAPTPTPTPVIEPILPEGITEINPAAFAGSAIESVVFPNTLTRVGARAFAGCASLTAVLVLSPNIEFGADVFTGCPANLTIYCPAGSTAYAYAAKNSLRYVLTEE